VSTSAEEKPDCNQPWNKKERWIMTYGRNGAMIGGVSFLAGLLAGGVAGLLYAPQSGARTRRQLVNVVDDAKERAGEMAEDAAGAAQQVVERGRRLVNM
jgi:gas vesicle protein